MSRQEQSAADGAFLVQGGRDASLVVHQGWDPDVINELMEAVTAKAAQQYALVAREEALSNARSFAKILIQELAGAGRLDILADPAFLHLLDKAHVKAATTKEVSEHEMLARLLAERAERADKPAWAAIDRAVEVVPLLDAKALVGLTVMDSAMKWISTATWVRSGFSSLDRIYQQLLVDDLPSGSEWLDHLDSQDCIRLNGLGGSGFLDFNQYVANNHPGYSCRGISSDELEEYAAKFDLPPFYGAPVFLPHDLLPDRWRPTWSHHNRAAETLQAMGLNERYANHIQGVAMQEAALTNVSEEGKVALGEALGDFPHLSALRDFWNEIPESFRITQVGKVVARANARQLDKAGAIPMQDI